MLHFKIIPFDPKIGIWAWLYHLWCMYTHGSNSINIFQITQY
jgi:hypothetical protein